MKVVQINSVCEKGSTGKICINISKILTQNGIENYVLYTLNKSKYSQGIRYMNSFEVYIESLKAKLFGNYGFQSVYATKKLIKKINEINPDIVQLHNLHGHNVNLQLLFSYLMKKNIKVFWTFHDCFAFTSYCMYFDMSCCDKWIFGCNQCPQYKKYSFIFDFSEKLYQKKKFIFSNLNMTIITPSKWLAQLTRKSFLNHYPVYVINNGIDLNIFKPVKSNFRKNNNISNNTIMLLGVANKWEERKGLDDFIFLSNNLDSNKYKIVLIGTDKRIDKKMPLNILSINRVENQEELVKIYSSADFFINPTKEDNFPTVNIEALACGTPVITYDSGGSAEMVTKKCGIVIKRGDIKEMCHVIKNCNKKSFSTNECVKRATKYSQEKKYSEYLNLYKTKR